MMSIFNLIENFLRREAFYVAVLLAVVTIGIIQTVQIQSGLTPLDSPATTMTYQDFRYRLTYLKSIDPRNAEDLAVIRYKLVRALKLLLFSGGIAAAAVLAFVWVSWGFKDRPTLDNPPWGLWDVLKVAAVFAAGSEAFRWILPGHAYQPFMNPNDWLSEAFARVLLIGTVLYVARGERNARLADLGIRHPIWYAVMVGTLGFLILQTLLDGIDTYMLRNVRPWPMQPALQAILHTKSSLTLGIAAFVAVVITPIAEELFFRGMLQPALQKWVGARYAIVLSAAFFALMHMDIYVIPIMLVMGVVLGYVYYRTRSIIAPVLVHMAHNGVVMLLLLSSRPMIPGN